MIGYIISCIASAILLWSFYLLKVYCYYEDSNGKEHKFKYKRLFIFLSIICLFFPWNINVSYTISEVVIYWIIFIMNDNELFINYNNINIHNKMIIIIRKIKNYLLTEI